mgnify:CR=1 FL=1
MMSLWQKFAVLSPYFGIHLLVLCVIMYAGWFLVTRKQKNFSYDWFTPAVLAFLVGAVLHWQGYRRRGGELGAPTVRRPRAMTS